MKRLLYPILALTTVLFLSCENINIYEKTVPIPGHKWKSDFKPSFNFDISDSSQVYQVFVVIRHTEKYKYNNIFLNLHLKGPGQDSALKFRQDLELASSERWLGDGMDDIYERRIPVGLLGDTRTISTGTYQFTLEQIMREDPLEHVLDIGIRVEKQ